jgi:hypothetical protein
MSTLQIYATVGMYSFCRHALVCIRKVPVEVYLPLEVLTCTGAQLHLSPRGALSEACLVELPFCKDRFPKRLLSVFD